MTGLAKTALPRLPVQLPRRRLLRGADNHAAFLAMAVQVTEVKRVVRTDHEVRPSQPRFVVGYHLTKTTPDILGAFILSDGQLDFMPCVLGANREVEARTGWITDQEPHPAVPWDCFSLPRA